MAIDKVVIPVEVTSNGTTDKEIQKANALKAAYVSAAAAAKGGTAGSRAAAGMSGQEYGMARGTTAATGASARDFANEAQGLGGLVRLYATYAANVFAVSAAFRALSDAMDTSNMIRGLDQLGASTGVAMGGLAKRFAEASGGAISLRESMESTAKAMSSGMSQKQFLVLGDVAKKASQALGVNMSDAVSRLTRGITKLEPELLDELGLFTKVGKASEDYARAIGKSVDNLTDFEKRQAFANAVLKEGMDKFKDIDIPTNPYDKLLASLKNVSQTILEVINKGLAPLVSFLSQSPTALTAVIAGLGTLILRQALPIFSSYRAAMQKATEEMKVMAEAKLATSQKALDAARKAKAEEVKLEKDKIAQIKTEQVDAAEDALRSVSKKGLSKKVQGVLGKPDIMSIDDKDLAILDKLGAKQTKVAEKYRDLAAAIRAARSAHDQYNLAVEKENAKLTAAPTFGSAAYVAQQRLESARKQAAGASLVSKVGETMGEAGTLAATKQLYEGLKTEKLGLFRGGLTAISGAATIAAGTIGNLVTIFSKFSVYLAVFTTIFEALDFAFSKNAKQIEAFDQAISMSEESVKAANETYKKFGEQLLPQNLIASAQALGNIDDSMKAVTDALKEADSAASGWDRFMDGFKTIWSGDLKSKYAESIIPQIVSGLKMIRDPKLRQEAEGTIKSILKTSDISAKGLEKAFSKISPDEVVDVGNKIEQVFGGISTASQKAAGNLTSVQDGFKALETSFANLSNTLNLTDQLSLFGKDLATQGLRLAELFKDPIAAAAELRDILSDTSKLKLLAPDSQRMLMANKQLFNDLTNQLVIYEKEISDTTKELSTFGNILSDDLATQSKKAALEAKQASARSSLQSTQAQLTDLARTMTNALAPTIDKGFGMLMAGYERAVAQSGIALQKGLVDILPKTGASVALSAELENKKIDLQINQLQETRNLIKEMELSRISSERIHLEDQRDRALGATTEPNLRAAIQRRADEQIAPLLSREKILKSSSIAAGIKSGDIPKTQESLKALEQELGAAAKIQDLVTQKQLNNIKAIAEARNADIAVEVKQAQSKQAEIDKETAFYKVGEEYRNLTIDQQYEYNDAKAVEKAQNLEIISRLESAKEITTSLVVLQEAQRLNNPKLIDAAQKALDIAIKQSNTAANQLSTDSEREKSERKRTYELAKQAHIITMFNIEFDKQNQLRKLGSDTEDKLADVRRQELDFLFETGQISIENYSKEKVAIERSKILRQENNALLDAQAQLTTDLIALSKEYNEATDATKREEISAKMYSKREVYDKQVEGIKSVYGAQKDIFDQQNQLSERQKGYADIFKNSFNSMADAMVEWARTGKLSGKELFTSLLADLARYEMRLQMMQAYGIFRNAVFGIGAGGGSIPGVTNVPNMDAGITALPGTLAAKGRVYDAGLQMFAKGGAFTNSIVTSPTLFKFAQGTGLMGEAGPEAIMPLKRDANGNLGVRTGKQDNNVEVVINNYSNAQATTKETDDGRGNRRIEVMIGEAAAGEMSRSGSSAQGTMRNTYGLAPQLIRR